MRQRWPRLPSESGWKAHGGRRIRQRSHQGSRDGIRVDPVGAEGGGGIGFNETLGSLNVYFGTDLHKRWIKETYGAWWARQPHDAPSGLRDEIRPLWRSLDRSLERERAASLRAADLFGLARATVLRCQVERLLGAPVLEAAGDAAFISAFMSFQDRIEDATAKAAVLPRTLSLPLVLWPVARMRRKLTRRLAAAIACAERGADPATLGSWLRAAATLPGELARRPSAQVAELAIGLLFASHKNPSIGAAQTLCALLELGDTHPTVRAAHAEAFGAPGGRRDAPPPSQGRAPV